MQPQAAVQITRAEPGAFILSSAESIILHGPLDVYALGGHDPPIWTFSDANIDIKIPACAFSCALGVRIFHMTYPTMKHWKDWTKVGMIPLYIMGPTFVEEIQDFAYVTYPIDKPPHQTCIFSFALGMNVERAK